MGLVLPKYSATGILCEPTGNFKRWWKKRHPDKLDFSGAVNEHELDCGLSGMGKSTLKKLQIIKDYQKGKSVILIDPLRETFRDTLHLCIKLGLPPSDVFILDLTRPDIGQPHLWLLEHRMGMGGVTIDGLIATIRNIPQWRKSIGERMIDIIFHLLKCFQVAGIPLVFANKFLTDFRFRHHVLLMIDSEYMFDFWDHIFKMRDARTVIESTRNKFSVLINHDYIRPFISKNYSNFSFRDLMNRPIITLIDLSSRYFKDDARALMSALLFYKIYEELLSRENEKKPFPVNVYCEEFHAYAIPELYLPIITGTRKFGAGLKIITQTLEALYPEERNIIMGTVGTITSFAVNHADSQILRDNMFTFTGKTPKKAKRDLFGIYAYEEMYSVGDERLNAENELKNQVQREFILKIRGKKNNKLWAATVSEMPEVVVSQAEEDEYRKAVARYWGYGSFLELPGKAGT